MSSKRSAFARFAEFQRCERLWYWYRSNGRPLAAARIARHLERMGRAMVKHECGIEPVALDKWAELFGVPRAYGESDASLKQRILKAALPPEAVMPQAEASH